MAKKATTRSIIQKDIDDRVSERFHKWVNDSQDLYDMADLNHYDATIHMVYCMLMGATCALDSFGISRAAAIEAFISIHDKTIREKRAQQRKESMG